MCGIIGILSHSDVSARLLSGLSRLEYRGYDSAGVAIMDGARVTVKRAVGKLAALRSELAAEPLAGRMGLGHTRWATHGAATIDNAHPHQVGSVTIVHNGIIENYVALKAELVASGVRFRSETDTEAVARYLDRLLGRVDTLDQAFQALLGRIVGSYALAVMFDGYPDLMFVARNGPPLAIGYGDIDASGRAEMFVGSDALALAPLSNRVSYLEDGDWAIVRPDQVEIFDRDGQAVTREITTVHGETRSVDKAPYRHFMLKEIHDQPESLARFATSAFDHQTGDLKPCLPGFDFGSVQRVVLVACGTAYYACLVAKYWFEQYGGLPVEVELASEFRYRARASGLRDVLIAVSQSGETADTLAALKHARDDVMTRIGVVNVPTSSIAREADAVVELQAGPEIGVASTKAFSAQMLALLALALQAGRNRNVLDAASIAAHVRDVVQLPRLVSDALRCNERIEACAAKLYEARDIVVLGRGALYPIALEAALKIKEISYIHAEGFAAGELKHGPIALVGRDVPVLIFDNSGALNDKTASNASEVAARGAQVWHIGPDAQKGIATPAASPLLTPFVATVAAQLLAYHTALARGTDVDQPRNLAKSVTVE